MARVNDILLNVRDVLADHNKHRWSDDTLLRLFNQGLKNFITQTKVLKLKSYIPIETNTAIYDMSPYAISIDRIQYLDKVLIGKTEEELDKINIEWQSVVGTEPKNVIFDNVKKGVFRIYPKVTESTLNNVVQNQPYGILIDIVMTDDLAHIPEFDNIAFEAVKYLTVYYIGKPKVVTLDTEDSELDLDDEYDDAMVAYISGQALRLDADTQNRAFGAEQLSIYNSYVMTATKKESESNNTFVNREIPYKGFI